MQLWLAIHSLVSLSCVVDDLLRFLGRTFPTGLIDDCFFVLGALLAVPGSPSHSIKFLERVLGPARYHRIVGTTESHAVIVSIPNYESVRICVVRRLCHDPDTLAWRLCDEHASPAAVRIVEVWRRSCGISVLDTSAHAKPCVANPCEIRMDSSNDAASIHLDEILDSISTFDLRQKLVPPRVVV